MGFYEILAITNHIQCKHLVESAGVLSHFENHSAVNVVSRAF